MGATAIGWTDFSVNPVRARLAGSDKTAGGYNSGVGHYCEKVSSGCKNCYSSTLQPKFGLPLFQDARNGAVDTFFDASKLDEVLRRRKPARFFWCDMTDMFGAWVPFEWIAAMFGVMAATPHLIHQVLTKRPERALEFFEWVEKRGNDGAAMFPDDTREWRVHQCLNVSARKAGAPVPSHHGGVWPLPQVHLGVSVEDQANADKRIPLLLECPAALHWVSAEPLLGPVDLEEYMSPLGAETCNYGESHEAGTCECRKARLGWVVAGAESGPGHRPMETEWVDGIVDQCTEAGVSVFVKQDSGPKPGKQGRLSGATWARKEFPAAPGERGERTP